MALEQAVAGPLATRHLADLGARVIKIERPGEGDFARHYDHAVRGLATHFVWLNRGKESVEIDLKSPDGVAVRARTARAGRTCSCTTPRPASSSGLGLDGETLRAADPRLVVVNISGYGSAGPRKDRKAYDMLVQAESGMVAVTGTPETATKTGIPTADIAAGLYAAMSALSALFRRERTGQGAVIDVSMFDAAVEWMGHPLYMQLYGGQADPADGAEPRGDRALRRLPDRGRADPDRRAERPRLADPASATSSAHPEHVDDPRFARNVDRVAHREECDAVVAACTKVWTTADLDERLAEVGIPAAQINSTADVLEHPQLAERDRWRPVETEVGAIRGILPPMTFRDVELPMGRGAGARRAHRTSPRRSAA